VVPGRQWWDTVGSQLYVRDQGNNWVIAVNQWPPGRAIVSDDAPANPVPGLFWWDPEQAQTFVWTGHQWVIAVNQPMGAPINSPHFLGSPTVPTPPLHDSSLRIANTQWVRLNLQDLVNTSAVRSFNHRVGAVTLTLHDIEDAGGAPLDSPHFTGMPFGPTPDPGSADGKLATTAFVMSEITSHIAGVASWNTRTGAVTLDNTDILDLVDPGGLPMWATLDSPNLRGDPHSITPPVADATTRIATTAYVHNAINSLAVTSFNNRLGHVLLTAADVFGVGAAPLMSPHFQGHPEAATQPSHDNSERLATTEFVHHAVDHLDTELQDQIDYNRIHSVHRWNQRTGEVVMELQDILAAHGAPIHSPHFTGVPEAPTAQPHTDNDQLATTKYVDHAVKAVPSGPAGHDGPAVLRDRRGRRCSWRAACRPLVTCQLPPRNRARCGKCWPTARFSCAPRPAGPRWCGAMPRMTAMSGAARTGSGKRPWMPAM
jgi:hypothetical protein